MKKQRKIVIAVSGLIIAVIIVFIIQNIVNTPKGGVCIEEGRIVNGSAPFTSLEVKDAMSELKSIFEKILCWMQHIRYVVYADRWGKL